MVRKYWEVLAGNIGSVYRGTAEHTARLTFSSYQKDSIALYGRVAGESVTLFYDGEIVLEHVGTADNG